MKNLIYENATITEKSKDRVLVEYYDNKQKLTKVCKYSGDKQIGEKVNLYLVKKENFWHILFLLIPVICVLIGVAVGFVFQNRLFQYILTLALGLVSFVVVSLLEKFCFQKLLKCVICE